MAMQKLDEWVAPTVHPEVRAHITSIVSALGGPNIEHDGRYEPGDDVLSCLKDLRRWIQGWDVKKVRHDVARSLAEADALNNDLLEIFSIWPEEGVRAETLRKPAIGVLEILNNLTSQIELKEEEKSFHNHKHIPYLQLAQVRYKKQILQHDSERVLRTAVRVALSSMAIPKRERERRDVQLIDIMLSFLRNVAQIEQPANLPTEVDETEISRSSLIDAFQAQDVFPVILSIASSIPEEFDVQDVYLMELLFHLLKGIDPEKLFMEDQRLATAHTNELKNLIQKEKAMLAGYAKHAPSRHNRFGTMIWVKREGEKVSTVSGQDFLGNDQRSLLKMDKSKKWDKPKMRGKRDENKERPTDEFDLETPLSSRARKTLRSFVEDFLDSSFNPLFGHLRKPFETMEKHSRVLPSQQAAYFYLISWFLRAQCARHKLAKDRRQTEATKTGQTLAPVSENDSFAIVASVLNQQTFILLNRFMQDSIDMKEWRHLNAGMKCLTQILKTVQEMADSPSEEDQDIAENIQNRIFYEATTHDKVLSVLRNYKDQGFGYLDACTELAHVFLRMLERYSKQNVDLHVRSIRRARKQSRKADGSNAQADAFDEQQDDVVEAQKVVTERKFDFHRFAARFATQQCVDTFVAFTKYYNDLSTEQLKRAHRYIHRVAFKMEQAVILYRVDYLRLFHKMVKGPNGLDPESSNFKEWEELVRHLFRGCIKKAEERPELIVEMLFTKINSTLFYLEHGYDRELPTSKPRAPAELEVKPGMDKKGEFGVAVSILLNQSKMDALAWLKEVLQDAVDERKAWEDARVQEKSSETPPAMDPLDELLNPDHVASTEVTAGLPSILVKPDSDERRLATYKDNKLRLLMTICGFTRLGEADDPDASWVIPSSLRSEELSKSRSLIASFEFDPPSYEEGKSALDFVRSKAVAAARKRRVEYDDDTEGDEGDGDLSFPVGGPTARKPDDESAPAKKKRRLYRRTEDGDVDEEELERMREKRRQTELEKRRKIKSDLMVHDSDDESDEERDQLFFSKEEQVRNNTSTNILKALRDADINSKPTRKRKLNPVSGKRAKRHKSGSDSENDMASESESELRETRVARRSSPMHMESDSESEGAATDTPLSSPHLEKLPNDDLELPSSDPINPSQEDPAMVTKLFGSGNNSAAESDEEDMPVRAAQRRNVRSGFVVDSDSE